MEEGNDDNADGSDGEAEEDDGHRDMEGYRDRRTLITQCTSTPPCR